MRSWWLAAGMALAVAACGVVPRGSGGTTGDVYADAEHRFELQVPEGWKQAKSMNPFKRPPYLVRFDAPQGEGSAVVRAVPLGGESCVDAARKDLGERGRQVGSEQSFEVESPDGDIPVWTADSQGRDGRGGRVRAFCMGGSAVLLEASAAAGRSAEVDAIVKSFAYHGERRVALAPKPKPAEKPLFVHSVDWPGQTLGEIARWYTGSYDNWKKLIAVNSDLTVPNAALRVGRQVKIPPELVLRHEPMPKPRARPRERAQTEETRSGGPATPPSEEPTAEREAPAEPAEQAPEPEPALPPVIGPK